MTAPRRQPLEVTGVNGTVTFDGASVTITRKGFLARATVGKGSKRIPLRQITAVQFKPAGVVVSGFIEFSLGGGDERRSTFGQQTWQASANENSVVFDRARQPAFEALRDAVERALMAPLPTHAPSPAPVDPVAQLQQLANLHRAGAITDAEFASAKQALLRRIQ